MLGFSLNNWAAIITPQLPSRTVKATKNVSRPRKVTTCYADKFKLLSYLAAVGLPVLTVTTPALAAQDDKVYVGAECRQLDPNPDLQDPSRNRTVLDTNGAMFNISKDDQTWICPIVRDESSEQPEFARITTLENGQKRVDCTFEVRDLQGLNPGSASPDSRVQTIISATPLKIVVLYSYGSGDPDVLSSASDHGYYFFRCLVPGRGPDAANVPSGVVTYIVTEQN